MRHVRDTLGTPLLMRIARVWRLDRTVYDGAQADGLAMAQAIAVLALAIVSLWLGGMGLALTRGDDVGDRALALLWIAPWMVVGWVMWSLLAYSIGGGLRRRAATFGGLLRALGYAHAPGIFYALILIPGLGTLVNLAILGWTTAAALVALRTVLNVSTGRALLLSLAGITLSITIRNLLRS
ncbi:MAG: hypothetical protein O7F09_02000 [Chloroflexi bacterium]|nr:hypothetical protein [Chloroflexota bacterium]